MRKGYGPTGVSFNYSFADFKADVAELALTGKALDVETVISGNTFTTTFSSDMTEGEMRVLFDKLDSVWLQSGRKLFQLFV